jgi:hypothetical protein
VFNQLLGETTAYNADTTANLNGLTPKPTNIGDLCRNKEGGDGVPTGMGEKRRRPVACRWCL